MAFGDFVQGSGTDAGSTTSSSTTFGSSTTAGNSIVVGVRRGNATHGTITVSDDNGNTYTEDSTLSNAGLGTHCVFRTSNISGKASHQITVTFNSADSMRYTIGEYSGNFALHGTPVATFGTGTAIASGNQVTTATCSLIGSCGTNSPSTITAGASQTLRNVAPAAPNTKAFVEDRNGAQAAGTYSATATQGANDTYIMIQAAYSDASAAGGPFPPWPDPIRIRY